MISDPKLSPLEKKKKEEEAEKLSSSEVKETAKQITSTKPPEIYYR